MRSVTATALMVLGVLGCGDDGAADDGGDPGGDAGPDATTADAPPDAGCMTAAGWSSAPDVLGGAIQETAVVAVAGVVYVIGGFDDSIGVVDAVRVFDPGACSWTDGPALPRPVHHANAAVVDGTIYVLGAIQGTGFAPIGDVWAYTPGPDGAWRVLASMPAGAQRGAAVTGAIDGVIYVAGGLASGAVAQVSAYSIATNTWDTTLPPLPQPIDHACGGVIGGKLYVVGGRNGTTSSVRATVYEYTPGGAWAERRPMPTARGGTACAIQDGRIIVAGGEGNRAVSTGVFADVDAYSAATDEWAPLVPMLTPRHGMGAAIVGERFYAPGGATHEAFRAVATHEILRL